MDKRFRCLFSFSVFLFFLAALLVGSSFGPGSWLVSSSAQQARNESHAKKDAIAPAPKKPSTPLPEELELTVKSPAAYDEDWDREYPQDQRKKMMPFRVFRP